MLGFLAALLLSASPATPILLRPAMGVPALGVPRRITAPDWTHRPTPEDILEVYPPHAFAEHRGGVTTLGCDVMADGGLTRCKVLADDTGLPGFAAATLKLASKFQMAPKALDGMPTADNFVRIAVRWTPPGPPNALDIERPARVTHPDWLQHPDGDLFDRYYPPAALEKHIEGHAAIQCTVIFDGTLSDCRVISETPQGAGFGRATLKTASGFRMRPQTDNGAPVSGAEVVIPVGWKLAPDAPPTDEPSKVGPPPVPLETQQPKPQ